MTESEWLAAFNAALQESDAEGLTMREIAMAWGMRKPVAEEKMRALAAQGRVKHAGTRAGVDLIGRPIRLPVYVVT